MMNRSKPTGRAMHNVGQKRKHKINGSIVTDEVENVLGKEV